MVSRSRRVGSRCDGYEVGDYRNEVAALRYEKLVVGDRGRIAPERRSPSSPGRTCHTRVVTPRSATSDSAYHEPPVERHCSRQLSWVRWSGRARASSSSENITDSSPRVSSFRTTSGSVNRSPLTGGRGRWAMGLSRTSWRPIRRTAHGRSDDLRFDPGRTIPDSVREHRRRSRSRLGVYSRTRDDMVARSAAPEDVRKRPGGGSPGAGFSGVPRSHVRQIGGRPKLYRRRTRGNVIAEEREVGSRER